MPDLTHRIERLSLPDFRSDLLALSQLLVDIVAAGDSVSFLLPFSVEHAEDWWTRTIADASENTIILVARDADGIVGTVQLHPAWAPNQPHRAEVTKLLVHERARRTGLGTRLMESVENEARRAGFTLLTLDAKRGGAAERLYRRMDWIEVGSIPRFAVNPDGRTPHDAVIFYKQLQPTSES